MTENTGRLFVYFGTPKSNRKVLARTVQTATGMKNIVKYTTRARKEGDVDGVDNHFISEEQFDKMLADGQFIDTTVNSDGRRFGVARADVDAIIRSGDTAFMTTPNPIDGIQGAYPDNVTRIFVFTNRDVYQKLLENMGEDASQIAVKLKYYDEKAAYGRTCEYALLNENIGSAFPVMMALARQYANP